MTYRIAREQQSETYSRKRRLAILPRPERKWLLTGTALATGFLAFGSGVGPASAACQALGGGVNEIICVGNNDGSVDQSVFVGGTDFDGDVDVDTTDVNNRPTYIFNNGANGDDHVLYIDGHPAAGASINIETFANTAMRGVGGTGLAAETVGTSENKGDIVIDSAAVVESGRNGIYAASYDVYAGNVTVTNRGVIGVDFVENFALDQVDNRFEVSGIAVDLVEGEAYEIGAGVGGNGIYASSGEFGDGTSGDVTVTNFGTVHAQQGGIVAKAGTGSVTVSNLSTSSIVSGLNGIDAIGGGGAVTVYNGDNSQNEPPIDDNPDGFISAGEIGINATNTNGGSVSVFNGLKYNSNSEIYASGDYGIYADSEGDGQGDGTVQAWNMGYVETEGKDALAGIYAGTDGSDLGYAGIYNGVVHGLDIPGMVWLQEPIDVPSLISPNARVNAYDINLTDGGQFAETNVGTANGLEIVVDGGFHDPETETAGKSIASPELFHYIGDLIGFDLSEVPELDDSLLSLNFTAFAYNYGTWDFEGADNYLTPGFVNGMPSDEFEVGARTTGGVFAPGGSALRVDNASNGSTGLFNYGTMIGEGNETAVISIETDHSDVGTGGFGDLGQLGDVPNFVFIYNAGYVEHTFVPEGDDLSRPAAETFATYGVIGNIETPSDWQFDVKQAFLTNFGLMANGGVDWDFVDGMVRDADIGESELGRFGMASAGLLLDTNGDGAGVLAFNQGLLIGRMDIAADNESLALLINDGTWFTAGQSNFYGSETDILLNTGLVQAAFDGSKAEETTFNSLNYTANFGVISLLDGAVAVETDLGEIVATTGDVLTINGDYVGGPGISGGEIFSLGGPALSAAPIGAAAAPAQQAKLAAPGYFALDTFLANENSDIAAADLVDVNGAVIGSTGLILRNDDRAEAYRGINHRGIDVVEYDELYSAGCEANNGVCAAGDAFYISSLTANYFEANGVGGIADGLLATYLVHDTEYGDFELQTTWSPAATNAPALVTGAQHIFYDTLSVVSDHSYGYAFGGAGGSGADLPVDAGVYDAPVASSAGSQYGLWVKGSGSWTEFDGTVSDNGIGLDGSTEGSQDTYSLLGGADMKWDPNSPFRFGVFGGYISSNLDFDNNGSVDYEGGTAGAYLAYNDGAFYIDGTVKGDWLGTDYTFANLDVDADVTNVGVAANTGYRFTMGAGYIEPIASFTYVHTSVDDIHDGAASVDFSQSDSIRAGAGARIGTAFSTAGGTTTDLSLLGKVWNEFEDANEVTVDDGNGNTTTFSDDISGVFGEVNAVASVTSANGLFSGFLSAGGEFGDDFTSYNAKVGIRKGF